jgi:hypothetical protein
VLAFLITGHVAAHAAGSASTGFWSSGAGTIVVLAVATILATAILGMGRAMMSLVRNRQKKNRDDEADQRTLSEFLFGTERDPRTGTPGKVGWTVTVDESLASLRQGQVHTIRLLNDALAELLPDNNGRHNLRGTLEKTAEAAGVEIVQQTAERKRVQRRDDLLDGGAA